MFRIRRVFRRLQSLFRKDRIEDDLSEELRFHLENEIEKNIVAGMTPEEARYAALRTFGGVEQIKEDCRDVRGIRWMETLWQDFRYGCRRLRKSPGFTLLAVLSLALGIGANTSIFSFVNAFVLRPFPVKNPDQLVALYTGDRGHPYGGTSYPNFADYRKGNQVFSELIAYWQMTPLNLSHRGGSERVWGSLVSGNYFSALGVEAAVGRTFLPEEDQTPGTHPVAVLSYRLWARRFGSNRNLLGQTVNLNGHAFTIIGIAPKTFEGMTVGMSPDIWMPLMMQEQAKAPFDFLNNRGINLLAVTGRLKPGISLGEAQASINILAHQLEQAHSDTNIGRVVTLLPISKVDPIYDQTLFSASGLTMGLVGLLLLIGCTNVAILQVARASIRQKEIGIRLALGATRPRLIRQLLTESILLALLCGAVGLVLAFWTTNLLSTFKLPYFVPISLDLSLDNRVLSFALILSLLTGILFGLAPALQASKPDLQLALKGEARTAVREFRRFSLRNLLVIAQTAVSLVLLIIAGLFVRSLQKARSMEPGFESKNVLTLSLDPKLYGYSEDQSKVFYQQLLERVEALPGVQSASLTQLVPLGSGTSMTDLTIDGQDLPADGKMILANYNLVSPGYFKTLGIPLLKGRGFTVQDRGAAPLVVIINETMAHRFWPGQVIGKTIHRGEQRFEVIGVAKDSMYQNWGEDPSCYMYHSLQQNYTEALSFPLTLLVRTASDPQGMAAAIIGQAMALDRHVAVFDIRTMTEQVRQALFLPQLAASLTGLLGALGLMLAAIGIYGAVWYSVAQRTHEIGVRIALGAQRSQVLKLVMGQEMVLTAIGLAIGLAIALAVTRVLSTVLYVVSATDFATFLCTSLLFSTVALVACYIPACRAAKVDPIVALRYE